MLYVPINPKCLKGHHRSVKNDPWLYLQKSLNRGKSYSYELYPYARSRDKSRDISIQG